MKIKPAPRKVVFSIGSDSTSSIIVPDALKDAPMRGKVVASASELYKEGDDIVCIKFAPEVVDLDGTTFYIIDEDDIIASIVS